MIRPDARLSIQRVPLERLQVKEYQPRYPGRLLHYIGLLTDNPGMYAGLLYATPSDTHPGMLAILDGHHKFAAAIIAGRPDVLCVVEEPPELEEYKPYQFDVTINPDGMKQFFEELAQQNARELEAGNWSPPPQTGPLDQAQD